MEVSERYKCFADRRDGRGNICIGRDEVAQLLKAGAYLWVDILAPTADDTAWLKQVFGFHDLALSDVLNNTVRPKQETYGDVLFTVFRAVNLNPGQHILDTINMNLFLNHHYLVTAHSQPVRTATILGERFAEGCHLLEKEPQHLYYLMLDGMVDRFMDLVDHIEHDIEKIEAVVFSPSLRNVREEIFAIQKKIGFLKRLLASEREALSDLVHSEFQQLNADTQTHLRDVLDHVMRMADNVESYRDNLTALMDSQIAQVSQRTNEVVKILSIVSTIMLPLTFLTGLFGMNFAVIPGANHPYGFWIAGGLMLLVATILILIFKRRRLL